VYVLGQQWRLVTLSMHWLLLTIAAAIAAAILVLAANLAHLTHISQSAVGAYGIIHTPKDFIHGIIYGLLGVLTNLGANPASDATTLRAIPATLVHHMLSL